MRFKYSAVSARMATSFVLPIQAICSFTGAIVNGKNGVLSPGFPPCFLRLGSGPGLGAGSSFDLGARLAAGFGAADETSFLGRSLRGLFGSYLGSTLFRQVSRLQALRRLPQALQVVKFTGPLGKNVDHKVHVIQQHPLCLGIALAAVGAQSCRPELFLHLIGDGLALTGVCALPDDKVISERA